MSELLVILACSTARGCQEASALYYQQHAEIRELVARQERALNRNVHPLVIQYIAPVMALAIVPEASVRLVGKWSAKLAVDKQEVIWSTSF